MNSHNKIKYFLLISVLFCSLFALSTPLGHSIHYVMQDVKLKGYRETSPNSGDFSKKFEIRLTLWGYRGYDPNFGWEFLYKCRSSLKFNPNYSISPWIDDFTWYPIRYSKVKSFIHNLICLGLSPQRFISHVNLLSRKPETIQTRYDNLINLGLTLQKIISSARLLSISPEKIQIRYDNLINLGVTPKKINTLANILSITLRTIQDHYDNLINLGLTPQKICAYAHLLVRDPDTFQNYYNNLINLGITPQKINTYANLLAQNPGTIQDHYDNLINLGLTPQKISILAHLLVRDPNKLQDYYDNLINLGLTPQKIISNAHLLGRNPMVVRDNYDYLIQLGFTPEIININAYLFAYNPDTIAIKSRVIKLTLLRLGRFDSFKPNKSQQFFITSSAKLVARIQFSLHSGQSTMIALHFYKDSWLAFFRQFIPSITKTRANELGNEFVRPYKRRYDE